MNKTYDFEKLFEVVKRIKDETADGKSSLKIGIYLKKAINALDVRLIDYENLSPELLQSIGDEARVYNSNYFSEADWISSLPRPSKGWENISSILVFPFCRRDYKPKTIYIFYGENAHQQLDEEIVPLKSSGETIGVTVRQTVKEIPERIFGEEEIRLLKEIFDNLCSSNEYDVSELNEIEVNEAVQDSTDQDDKRCEEKDNSGSNKVGIIQMVKSIFKL